MHRDPSGEQREQGTPSRRGRRRRALRGTAIALAVLAFVAWAGMRTPAPVGHFTSAEGHDAYVEAYERAMAELPEPDDVLDLRTDYGVVRMYRFEATSPEDDAADFAPLVLLPGRASGSPVWGDNLAGLRELGTVYLLDLLGEPGTSVQARPVRTDEEQAEWLHQALAQLPGPQVHLLGMSIGGWTAVNLAVHRPDTLASLTLLEPAMTFADMPLETIVRSVPASVPWLPQGWRDGFNSWTAGGAPVEDVPVADMIEAGMQHYAMKLPAPTRFSEEQLGAIEVPVLAILAEDSVMHDAQDAARQAEATLAHGRVLTYADASHAINGEHPEQIADDVAEFLSGLEE